MTNLGSPKTAKEHARISGNVVITDISLSGISVTVSVSGQPVYISTSGSAIQVSGTVSVTSGTGVRISGESVFAYISGGSFQANVSGQVVYVGETCTIQRDLGSNQSVIVGTMYIAPQPIKIDVINLNLATAPVTVISGIFRMEILTSASVFPFVRTAFDYRTRDYPNAKSICYYPDPPMQASSGDIITLKYTNNTSEYAEARVEVIMKNIV